MNELTKWNYDDSIKKVKQFYFKWKNLNIEVIQELYIARQNLSKTGRRWTKSEVITGANAPVKTWDEYCDDCGIEKSTANRWLQRYIPEEKKLLTDIEFKNIIKDKNVKIKKEREKKELVSKANILPIIIKTDCMKIIDKIQPIDLLIADPPYFTDGDFTKHISAYLKKVKPTGQAYIFMSADPNEIKAYLSINTHGMVLEQILIWCYNNTGQRQPNIRYTSNYQVYFYYRGIEAKNINKPADGKEQYACQTVNAPDGRVGDRYHEWQKPEELIKRLIKNSSQEGDFVFDPFAGTGTTLISAGKLGRVAHGCEIDAKAIRTCKDRGCNELE